MHNIVIRAAQVGLGELPAVFVRTSDVNIALVQGIRPSSGFVDYLLVDYLLVDIQLNSVEISHHVYGRIRMFML